MAERDDLQNLGGDLGLPQRRVLLGLSSGLPDTAPLPRIALSRLRLSNDASAINGTINNLVFLSLTVSAPPERKVIE